MVGTQFGRACLQTITLLNYFMLLEKAFDQNGRMLPPDPDYKLAREAGEALGVPERTVCAWYYQYWQNDSKLLRDQRGRYVLE